MRVQKVASLNELKEFVVKQSVAILGASDQPDRYAFKAFNMLKEYGHTPLPVSRNVREVEGVAAVQRLTELSNVDTVTMYVNPKLGAQLKDDIVKLKPKRVIFNPGTENHLLMDELKSQGIEVVEACTLVMLRTGQF